MKRLQLFILRRMQRALETGRILPYLILTITGIVVGFAVLMRLLDAEEYPSLGRAVWWSVQTVTTVGYGDVTPARPWGRLIASGLMIIGFASLSLFTGIVASLLVHRRTSAETQTAFGKVEQRLEELEQLVRRQPG
jgi:voltage-gated potassium channel Kch